MNIILYTIDCPRCIVLEKKLQQKNINFSVNKDKEEMFFKGFTSAPMLEVDGKYMDFFEARRWIDGLEENNGNN